MSSKNPTPEEAFEFLMKCSPPSKEEMLLLGWKTDTTGQRSKVTAEMLSKKETTKKKDAKADKKGVKEVITTQ